MGLLAIYQKPRTTVPGIPSEQFPSLVDIDKITSIDQALATDITYIPLRKGFLNLVAIVDLFSRNILNWKLSNSLDTEFCIDALEMTLASGIRISLPGTERCYDNILVERIWCTLKHEEVHLQAYSDGWEAEISLARFLWRAKLPMRSTAVLKPVPPALG